MPTITTAQQLDLAADLEACCPDPPAMMDAEAGGSDLAAAYALLKAAADAVRAGDWWSAFSIATQIIALARNALQAPPVFTGAGDNDAAVKGKWTDLLGKLLKLLPIILPLLI